MEAQEDQQEVEAPSWAHGLPKRPGHYLDQEQSDGTGIFYQLMSAGAQEMAQHLPKAAADRKQLMDTGSKIKERLAMQEEERRSSIRDMVSHELAKRRGAKQPSNEPPQR